MPVFYCVDCGWEWPYDVLPDSYSECDYCGGELVTEDEYDPNRVEDTDF